MAESPGEGVKRQDCVVVRWSESGLPIIDLEALLSDDQATITELHRVCRDEGFFYVSNLGFDDSVIENALQANRDFFNLPKEQKEQVGARNSHLFRGYQSLETGSHNCKSNAGQEQKESYVVGSDLNDSPGQRGSPLHGDNQWPENYTPDNADSDASKFDAYRFRTSVESFKRNCADATRRLCVGLAMALGKERDFFSSKFTDPVIQCVLFKYPPLTGTELVGCGEHTDVGFLTLLAQDDVGGIEIFHQNEWKRPANIKGTLLVNFGRMFQEWSGGEYKATLHRVRTNTNQQDRHSIVFFSNADYHAKIDGLGVIEGHQLTAGEYLMVELGMMFKKKANDELTPDILMSEMKQTNWQNWNNPECSTEQSKGGVSAPSTSTK